MSIAAPATNVSARIARRLADSLGARRYSMWFDRSAQLHYRHEPPRLEVNVPNRFVADWIGRNFSDQLRSAALSETGTPVELLVQVAPEGFESAAAPASVEAPAPAPAPRRPRTGQRIEALRHRLQDFVVGAANQLAFASAQRLVESDDPHARILFLHGACGLGKTHLLQGICRRLLESKPDAQVLYTTGEQFTNEFVDAVRTNRIDAFRRKIRQLDLLAVDDVHFIANKQATQQEFLHSFDAIGLSGSRVALASDNHPKLIQQFSDALVSRCLSGVVVQITPPDLDTRVRIVQSLADRRDLMLLDSVAHELAVHCQGSVREIEGMLAKLHALATMDRPAGDSGAGPVRVGHTLLNRLLGADVDLRPRKIIRFDAVLDTVAAELNTPRNQVVGSSRQRQAVLARSLVIYLARQLTSMSYPEIAAAMGRPNHSTIITAAQRVQKQLQRQEKVTLPVTLETLPMADLIERLKPAILRA